MIDIFLFLIAVLTVLGTPGPTNTLLATAGATTGWRAAWPLLFGELFGYLISIGMIRLALGPLLAAAPMVAVVLKIAVAAYLLWNAIDLWRRTLVISVGGPAITVGRVFVATLLNPKALIFALTIFPHDPSLPWLHITVFAASVAVCGFSWILAGHALAAAAGERTTLIPRLAALALAGFAGFILYSAFG